MNLRRENGKNTSDRRAVGRENTPGGPAKVTDFYRESWGKEKNSEKIKKAVSIITRFLRDPRFTDDKYAKKWEVRVSFLKQRLSSLEEIKR